MGKLEWGNGGIRQMRGWNRTVKGLAVHSTDPHLCLYLLNTCFVETSDPPYENLTATSKGKRESSGKDSLAQIQS
jgi:hypothetical protein